MANREFPRSPKYKRGPQRQPHEQPTWGCHEDAEEGAREPATESDELNPSKGPVLN